MAPPTVTQALPYQLFIKQMPHSGGIFSAEIPSSEKTLVCVKLTLKTSQRRKGRGEKRTGTIPKGNGTLQSDLVYFPPSAPTCSLPGSAPVQTSSTGSLSGLARPRLRPAKPVSVLGNVSLVASPNGAKHGAALSRPLAPQLSALLLQVTPSKDAFQETYPKGTVFFFFNTEVQAFPRKIRTKGEVKFAEWPNGTLPRIFPQGNPGLFPRLATLRGILSSLPARPKPVPFRATSIHFILWASCFPAIPNSCP